MSFILDALKKLEEKHRPGSVPDLMTVHTPGQRKSGKRFLWSYLILAALTLNAVILAVWLHPWGMGGRTVTVQPAVEERDEPMSTGPEQKVIASNKPLSTSSHNINTSEESASGSDTLAAGKVPGNVSLKGKENAGTGQEEESLSDDEIASLNLDLSQRELEVLRSKIRKEMSPLDETPLPESAPVDNDGTVSGEGVIDFSQLPPEVKRELRNLSISGHIYSNNPGARIVNINGRIIREGEAVTGGLKLEEITMTGVIFDYQGLRFRKRAF